MINLAILQPHVPHYRESFFKEIEARYPLDIYCYSQTPAKNDGFSEANVVTGNIPSTQKGPILLYNPSLLVNKKYTHLVLMLHFGHITTWLLLLTKFFHGKKIILWGQGISVKRYLQEERRPDWKLRLMISRADAVWLYTEKEAHQWRKIFKSKPIAALNNTLSVPSNREKTDSLVNGLKLKYGITQPKLLIFSARFENPFRRTDLLEKLIQILDPIEFGFIIIGDGALKPDFSQYDNVYDFGRMYENAIKSELFTIADIYFQPGWVGLSIVEAMRYGLPIYTFRRTEQIKQCVEYHYIQDHLNGRLFNSLADCVESIQTTSIVDLKRMGQNAQNLAEQKLTVQNMVSNALNILQ